MSAITLEGLASRDTGNSHLELVAKVVRGSSSYEPRIDLCRTCSSDWQVAMERMTMAGPGLTGDHDFNWFAKSLRVPFPQILLYWV